MPYLALINLIMAGILMLAGCVGMRPEGNEPPRIYSLEASIARVEQISSVPLSLLVSMPRAAPGFDAAGMAYVRHPFEIEYFSKNQWVEPPAKMLWPLLVSALEIQSGYRSVTAASGMVQGDIRLDIEISNLQQEFVSTPSRMHIKLRAQLVDQRNFEVLATQIFEAYENAPTEAPYGGVVAANRALKSLLGQIASFANTQGVAFVSARKQPTIPHAR